MRLLADLVKEGDTLPAGYEYPLAAYLARVYHEMGHEVCIVSNVHGAERGSSWSGERCVIRLNPRRRLKEFVLDAYRIERKDTVNAIHELNPDIVHAQWVYDHAHAAVDSGMPHLVTIRDYPWAIAKHTRSPYRVFRALYAHRVVPRIQNLSAISPYVAQPFKTVYRYKRPVRLIPNGLASHLFASEEDAQKDRKGQTFVSVSGWDPRKNVKSLLRAFNLLSLSNPTARLLLVGGGLDKGGAGHEWAAHNKLSKNVSFIGRLDHAKTIQLLRERADVFVHSTLEESFCMTVLEAMAQGLPVVALPDSGAVPWLLDSGGAGCIAESQSAEHLAYAMRHVIEDENYRISLANSGFERAKSKFTLERVAEDYLQAYRDVVSGDYNLNS